MAVREKEIRKEEIIMKENISPSTNDEEMIFLDCILPNDQNPRSDLHSKENQKWIDMLAESLKDGAEIEVPPIVEDIGNGKYKVIDGDRRLEALKRAEKEAIPKNKLDIRRNISDIEKRIIQAKIDGQRKNLSSIDRGKLYRMIREDNNWTQVQLAKYLSIPVSYVCESEKTLTLNENTKGKIRRGEIYDRSARDIARLKDKSREDELIEEVINKKISVKDTAKLVTHYNRGNTPKKVIETPAQKRTGKPQETEKEPKEKNQSEEVKTETYMITIHADEKMRNEILEVLRKYQETGMIEIESCEVSDSAIKEKVKYLIEE